MLKCYRIIERGSDDEYGTREFVNELDIKECRLVQTATGRCCIRCCTYHMMVSSMNGIHEFQE